MRSKAVLTLLTVLSVTLLSACGENKSKKATFRPRGRAKAVAAVTPNSCPKLSPGGRGTVEEQCVESKKNLASLIATNEKCRPGILVSMQALKCEITEADRNGQKEERIVGENTDAAPGKTQVITTTSTETPTTAEGVASLSDAKVLTINTDAQTGDVSVEPAVPLKASNVNTDDIAPVVAEPATSTVPSSEASTTVPSANAVVLTGIPSTCSAEQIATAKADKESCSKLTRVNNAAVRFSSILDFKSDADRTPSRWSTFVCVQSEHTGAEKLVSAIKRELPEATTTAKCSSSLTTLTITCARAIKCGGQKDVMSLARLPSDPTGPDSDETLGDKAAAPASAPAAAPATTSTAVPE